MTRIEQFPISVQSAFDPTATVKGLLTEIASALKELINNGVEHQLDLMGMLLPEATDLLLEQLGRGEISITLSAMGDSEIYETSISGVWVVSHFNTEEELIAQTIEITRIPGIITTPQEELITARESLDTLMQSLASMPSHSTVVN